MQQQLTLCVLDAVRRASDDACADGTGRHLDRIGAAVERFAGDIEDCQRALNGPRSRKRRAQDPEWVRTMPLLPGADATRQAPPAAR